MRLPSPCWWSPIKSEEGIDILLDRALARCSFDSRERSLTVELTYGVLRRLATIDWRLEPVLDKPLPRLPVAVQMVLRLGAYQVLFLDRIPQSAAVNESVNLAKAFAGTVGRDWSGFVNAVLRALLRHPPEPWPDMDLDAAQALAVRYSVPGWLSRRWVERLGAGFRGSGLRGSQWRASVDASSEPADHDEGGTARTHLLRPVLRPSRPA